MLSIFRDGRQPRQSRNASRDLSSFAASPDTSRHPLNRRSTKRRHSHDNEAYEDERQPLRPRRSGMISYLRRGRRGYDARYDDESSNDDIEEENNDFEDGEDDEDDLDGHGLAASLLPIFSATHLDRLPVYNVTHAFRQAVLQRCETTLSWEQLRSPQVSQFLVKPIQNEIRANHFNRATLFALIANCLQFQKEVQQTPANLGVSRTRALICELLAMRLLKEFSSRELIDALSYDFDPLQGLASAASQEAGRSADPGASRLAITSVSSMKPMPSKGARVSTIEIAIRAQAKRFLAHPVVVQHLEAIWAGAIVFHSIADNLHRNHPLQDEQGIEHGQNYGTMPDRPTNDPETETTLTPKVTRRQVQYDQLPLLRRSVTLYDPSDASLFKLSRLRVPRYRQLFSTLSFGALLGLFLAVLAERDVTITPIEVVFWFWSVGYMLDEVVGFTEQGFSLYILSFWNVFDLGILLLLAIYFVLRICCILAVESDRQALANYAYDVLASTAILLFPRLFSVLDHYRYFSQLLIAFRMMAVDLMAIMVLIMILCSGFFAAFTLAFTDNDTSASSVAYGLFQIVMGFTPAAWDRWFKFNLLGRIILAIFLILCHFVIVTVLITVLTNSFMAIVRNAEEEHQFLFAINTISMVKSDSLFSYIAPGNVVGWLLSPLRFVLPFRQFLKTNRTIIKVTHFPLLLLIFVYERVLLSKFAHEPISFVASRPVARVGPLSFNKERDQFTSGRHLREPSAVGSSKDRALNEVFRRPYAGETIRTTARDMEIDRGVSGSAVAKWMQNAENEGGASPPLEQPRSVVDRLELRKPPFRHGATADQLLVPTRSRDFAAVRSMTSDPDILSTMTSQRPYKYHGRPQRGVVSQPSLVPPDTDADGDDENNGDSDNMGPGIGESVSIMQQDETPKDDDGDDYFLTPLSGKAPLVQPSPTRDTFVENEQAAAKDAKRARHTRTVSSTTMLYAPLPASTGLSSPSGVVPSPILSPSIGPSASVKHQLDQTLRVQRTPGQKPPRHRPSLPMRQKTAPGLHTAGGLTFAESTPRRRHRNPSFYARALDLASDLGDNKWAPAGGGLGTGADLALPASFNEQIFTHRRGKAQARDQNDTDAEASMVNRILLARMNRLEEGFREVLGEIKAASRRDSEAEGSSAFRTTAASSSISTSKNARKTSVAQHLSTDAGSSQKADVPPAPSSKADEDGSGVAKDQSEQAEPPEAREDPHT